MTKIEEMLAKLCPNGVEWKELGEVLDYEQPTKYIVSSKEYNEKYPVPVLTAGQSFILGYTNETEGIYIANKENPVIIFDDFTTATKWVDFEFKVKSSAMKILTVQNEQKDEILIRYIWHCLGTITYKPDQHGRQWIGTYSKIKIPIPPLEIQQEIVQILDKLTEYVTELTTELTLRQKQYTYFRDYLLNFDQDGSGGANNKVYEVEWKTLGEVFEILAGGDVPKDALSKTQTEGYPIPILSNGIGDRAIYGWTNIAKITEPSLTISARGTIGWTSHRTTPFYPIVRLLVLTPKISINLRYAYHYMKSIEQDYDIPQSGIPQLTRPMIVEKAIPLPSLDIQSRIVQVLDNFDLVCNDLNIGLPKEIELRQKQYEYFRDKLLTFTAEGVYTDSTVQYRQDLIRLLQWVFGPIRVSLGAICDFTRGNGLQKKDFVDEGCPVIHYGQIYTRYGFSIKDTVSFTSQAVFDKLKKAKPNDIVMATTSENVEDVGKAVVWEGTENVGVSGDAYIVQTSQNARYLNHFFKSVHFQSQKEKKVTGTKVIRINAKDMENFFIQLPDLEKQQQIVNILDKFDTLTADLTQGLPKEIQQRQQQYEYFRNELLKFEK